MRKKREDKIKESMMLQQQNAQVQQQSAMMTEEEKRKTMAAEFQLKAQLLELEYRLRGELAAQEQGHRSTEGNANRAIQAAGVLSNAQVAANASNAEAEVEEEEEDIMPMPMA